MHRLNQKRSGMAEHRAKHTADFDVQPREVFMLLVGDVSHNHSEKSSDVSVSLFSPSQSVSLLMKCASYRRLPKPRADSC